LSAAARILAVLALPAAAQPWPHTPPERTSAPLVIEDLPPMIVQGETETDYTVRAPFPAAVEGQRIFAGKKATVLDLDALPQVQANNYRQALALTPGLLFSEETSPLVSLGYRGIGEPHRMQYLQVLKDGIPIHADPFGYPEAYYTPPLDVVDRIEFLRGGAGLMYGPQPAGALNFITYQPRRDRAFSGRTQHAFGSDGLYSTYNAVDGTVGRLGYLAYYNHRRADGFRDVNSDYQLDGGHFKVVLDADQDARWLLAFDAYEEGHGEPGGLTFATGPNAANYHESRDQTPKPYDRFQLRRYVPSLRYERDFSADTQLSVAAWGGYYDRASWRQRGGGFGLRPSGAAANSNDIERQEFYNFGLEPRLRHDWSGGGEHTLAAGLQYFRSHSPRTDRRGAAPDARDGILFRAADRDVNYGAVFAENRFAFGPWSLTPGVRLENVAQDLELTNYDPATGAFINRGAKDQLDVQPLVALAVARDLGRGIEAYAGVAQSYRPTVFTETLIVPPSGVLAPGDLSPAESWTYEAGVRGEPTDWLTWDASLFLVDLDNKFGGTVSAGGVTTLRTVGRSLNRGADLAVQLDLVGAFAGEPLADAPARGHRLELYGNLSLLDAEIDGGVSDGFRPQYAPEYLLRAGVIWRWTGRLKLALLGTVVDDHFATDDENPTRRIPAYSVWDFTAEARVWREHAFLLAGVNNLFDEDYYARIRADGIDPAYRRNFYAGVRLTF
jgi:Fe(3+) dicitrate transport protein